MPLSRSIKLIDAYCKKFIRRLESLRGTPYDSPTVTFCILGVEAFRERLPDIQNNITVATPFWDEFIKIVKDSANNDACPDTMLAEQAFVAIECMASIFQELRLRQPELPVGEGQTAIHRHFEESDEWQKEDGKLVTEYYYFLIPEAVKRLEA